MKKVAFDGDLFNATIYGHTEKYTNPIGDVASFREIFSGKTCTPLVTGLFTRGYVRHFSDNFADTHAKKPTPILANAFAAIK